MALAGDDYDTLAINTERMHQRNVHDYGIKLNSLTFFICIISNLVIQWMPAKLHTYCKYIIPIATHICKYVHNSYIV